MTNEYNPEMCIRDRNYSEDDNPVALKADFILSLCELIMGSKDQTSPRGLCRWSAFPHA